MKITIKKSPIALSIMLAFLGITVDAQAATYRSSSVIDSEINSAYDLLRFQEQMSKENIESREELISRSIRLRAMTDYAKSVAIRSGIKARIATINDVISTNSRELDAIYDFPPLMIEGRVVPPVISEANNLYNQKGDIQITTAAKIFKIERQARFASTAPNWREYLNFPVEASAFEKYTYVVGDLKPKDDIELKAWQDATVEGWDLGVNQANIILKQGMDRLNRDYVGMIRFHQFVMQGKLTMPVISQYKLYDNNDGMTMVIDEDLLRINALPTFNDQAIISSLTQHQLNQDEYVVVDEKAFIETPKNIDRLFNINTAIPVNADSSANTDMSINMIDTSIDAAAPAITTQVDYSQPIIESVQSVLNDDSKDGIASKVPNIISKQITTAQRLLDDRQSSVGIYGSQNSKDTLLINIKTRQIDGVSN